MKNKTKRISKALATMSALGMLWFTPALALKSTAIQDVDLNKDGITDRVKMIEKDTNKSGTYDFFKIEYDISSDGKIDVNCELKLLFPPSICEMKIDYDGDGQYDTRIHISGHPQQQMNAELDLNNDGVYDKKVSTVLNKKTYDELKVLIDENYDGVNDKEFLLKNDKGTIERNISSIDLTKYNTKVKNSYLRLRARDIGEDGTFDELAYDLIIEF